MDNDATPQVLLSDTGVEFRIKILEEICKQCKINAVKHFPTPQSVENVRSFLGLAGYNRAFVRNFASIASPLARLLKKDVPCIWHDAQRQAFESLKHALTQTPVLAFSDYKKPFILCMDASSLGVGAVLMQASESQRPHVIAYASRVRNSAESKYSVTHLEALALCGLLNILRTSYMVTPSLSTRTTLASLNFLVGRISLAA